MFKAQISFTMLKQLVAGIISLFCLVSAQSQTLQKIYPVNFSQVNIIDPFWTPKQQTVATATLDACVNYTQHKTARIRNFDNAANHSGKHEGIYYDDSDVYKAIEAIAYSLNNRPDAELQKISDDWINKIAAAQLPDCYVKSYYQLTDNSQRKN